MNARSPALAGEPTTLPQADAAAAAAAVQRQRRLTKPTGSLGRLEQLAIFMASWQGRAVPVLERPRVVVFVGWHGIARRGVSAYPAEVTGQMLANFRAGGAAINQLARGAGAALDVIAVREGEATASFDEAPAMSEHACREAMSQGAAAVPRDCDLLALGEMGIGNTTSASALCALLAGEPGASWAGPGTGLDEAGVARKAAVIDAARHRVGPGPHHPLSVLAEVGGHEIAALAGAILEARRRRIPVLLDGFVVTAAAAVVAALDRGAIAHCLVAHHSAEPAHARLLARLHLVPLLDLEMRLGEGSGAALAIPLVRAALACHANMATFTSAGVSDRR